MNKKNLLMAVLGLVLVLPVSVMILVARAAEDTGTIPIRPRGPCDIYTEDGNPCVAAHSTTRALYASYNGPLYEVMRMSDGETLDIGVVQPSEGDPGGYADAAAQDEFCADTYCWITTLYDQSGMENHLVQAPRGAFIGPSMGGFNNVPMADMAPVTLMGHKVYGIFIAPDMGLRWNDAKGTAVDDQAEGQYWVISGHHYNDGCCFDYGNAETDSRDDGDGTMETTYYGNASLWYRGTGEGPWIMTDQENNLVGCVNPSPNDRFCEDLPSIAWRFVTATADGKPHRWRMMGGNAQKGALDVLFDGPRIINDRNSYDPMRKQGAILLGNGGDNNNFSQGTFYEAAMTAPGTYPSEETCQKVQANIVAAGYDLPRVSIAPAAAVDTPTGLQTFAPKSAQNTTVTFVNTTGEAISDLKLSIDTPRGWDSVVLGTKDSTKVFSGTIAPGATVSATFTVTSGSKIFNGDMIAEASWNTGGKTQSDIAIEKVRNVNPVKINEFRIGNGTNMTDTFIELYNAGNEEVNISMWELTQHATQLPIFSSIKIPSGTKLAPNGFYLLGLSTSGLAVPAEKGDSTIYLRSSTGISIGDEIKIGTGSDAEVRKVVSISTPPGPRQDAPRSRFGGSPRVDAGVPTTVWQPLPDGPVITIEKGSKNIPVASVANVEVGQKLAIGYGAEYPTVSQAIEKYEVVTVTEVGKPGTLGWLSMDAKAGDTNIKVSDVRNITAGDRIRLDIDSVGHGIEWVTIKSVGTASSRNTFAGPLTDQDDPGTGLELEEPLKFDHASNMPFSARGTGISFEPATKFDHSSNEPVLPLCYVVELDQPLKKGHVIEDVVLNEKAVAAGYQGDVEPNQWFGGPALNIYGGTMVLTDDDGNAVDTLNYGEIVDPWAAEGYHGISGAQEYGCFVPSPVVSGGSSRPAGAPAVLPDRSSGRFPDGNDTDSNCNDFQLQQSAALAMASEAGADNVKIQSADGFSIGQRIYVGEGAERESVIVATVGTAGGTTASAAVNAGDTVIPVVSADGFRVGQSVVVGSGEREETAVITAVTIPRGWGGNNGPTTITVAAPLKNVHDAGDLVAGTGLMLASPLVNAHARGDQIAESIPTPGTPNMF